MLKNKKPPTTNAFSPIQTTPTKKIKKKKKKKKKTLYS